MKADDELVEALEHLYYAGIDADSIQVVGGGNNKAAALQRIKAAIQAERAKAALEARIDELQGLLDQRRDEIETLQGADRRNRERHGLWVMPIKRRIHQLKHPKLAAPIPESYVNTWNRAGAHLAALHSEQEGEA